jgi:A/G-specific adenine glycosylase
LLERRPPNGIWGGLWCLPQDGLIRNSPQVDVDPLNSSVERRGFEHSFTHFKMKAQVFELASDHNAVDARLEEATQRWVKFADLAEYGLPAPIKVYLAKLF